MNYLKYHENANLKHFYDNIFEKGDILIINHPTWIFKYLENLIANILTTSLTILWNKELVVSEHFPIFFVNTNYEIKTSGWRFKNTKSAYDKHNITFNEQLPLLHWRHIEFNGTMKKICETPMRTLTHIYDANLSEQEYILKDKDIKSSWISKVLKKSSKKKQRLYIKFLKTNTLKDEFEYKTNKNLSEKLLVKIFTRI